MSIIVTEKTKVIVQGITGEFGGRHTKLSLDYGTLIVAGVTPGKGGQFFEHGAYRVPIFNMLPSASTAYCTMTCNAASMFSTVTAFTAIRCERCCCKAL